VPCRLVLPVSTFSSLSIPDRLLRKLLRRPFLAALPEGRPFEIKKLEGKGMGVVATRDIKAGEFILKETPLVWGKEGDTLGLLRRVETLPELKKAAYDSHFIAAPHEHLPKALAIFKTNGLALDGDSSGLFDEGSRFNHSCLPNCSSHWDEGVDVRWFIANRDIRKGEEICITYGRTIKSRLERQEWLKRSFGFLCGCEACSYTEGKVIESDRRRLKINQVHTSLGRLQTAPLEVIQDIKIALKLLEEEGLITGAGYLAGEALNACVWFADRLNAIRWTDKLLEIEMKEAGIWSTQYKESEAWKGDPTRHPAWNDACRQLGIPPKVFVGPE